VSVLDPNWHKAGMTSYYHVADIRESLASLLTAGAQVLQGVKNLGGGKLMASVKHPDGNIMGLSQAT
jgi:predicted enzyme related to lactoylglutathione lyase